MLILAVGVFGCAALVVVTRRDVPTNLRQSQIGRSTADALGAYIQAHHLCPLTLEAIGPMPPSAELLSLHYRAWDGRMQCEFTAGDYGLQGFEEYWHYPPGDWRVYRE